LDRPASAAAELTARGEELRGECANAFAHHMITIQLTLTLLPRWLKIMI
jgi:hypothetical protein